MRMTNTEYIGCNESQMIFVTIDFIKIIYYTTHIQKNTLVSQ